MTNEAKLNEAMKLFQHWCYSYSDELVTISSNKYAIEVTLYHKCTEDVAELIAEDANKHVQGQLAAYVHDLKRNKKCTISIDWMKED